MRWMMQMNVREDGADDDDDERGEKGAGRRDEGESKDER